VNVAGGIAFIGALTLLVGLSLDWYDPEISAWTAFEVVDILLAAIAVGVVVVAVGRSPERPQLEAAAGWLPAAAVAALVLVVVSLINPPPAAVDLDLAVGAWVSLAGAILLVVAAVMATTYLSLVVTMRPRPARRPAGAVRAPSSEADWEEPFDEAPPEETPTDDRLEVVEEQRPFDDEPFAPEEEPHGLPEEEHPGLRAADEPPEDETETRPFPPR